MKTSGFATSRARSYYGRSAGASLAISSEALRRTQEADAALALDHWGYEQSGPAAGSQSTDKSRWPQAPAPAASPSY
ncbi:hypothetical protein [Hymenobacter arizonensis]|uniref:Uncharacterized protein n=1 Tax=Hymenobacter arizonensis TaxID=1227077 RepID=A0A1I6AIQ7_HYMAR|nr:hypothetical protein [Hymenobacter arizonensis]SFQ68532.1 hypothetical protein SAMN04515668_3723 [Hymenobacter arizonensis]